MKRINKNLVTFVVLISVLGISFVMVLMKLLPLAQHTSYYCQSLINSFSMSISHYILAIPFILLFMLLTITITKLLIILAKAQFLKIKLMKKSHVNTSFSTLLEKLQLTDKTYFIESNKQFAFCLGIRSPKIYISTSLVNLLSTQEVEAVLRHERYHLNNRDTLTMLVALIGESLFPFLPLISDVLHNYRIEREIKADQEAIRGLGDEKPLIAVFKKMLGVPSVAMASVVAIADRDTLEPRILKLVKKNTHFKKFKLKNLIISVFSIFVMGIVILFPVQAFEMHYQGQDIMMICSNKSSCINACKQEYATEKVNHSQDSLYSPIK